MTLKNWGIGADLLPNSTLMILPFVGVISDFFINPESIFILYL